MAYICKWCNRSFNRLSNKTRHENNCLVRPKIKITFKKRLTIEEKQQQEQEQQSQKQLLTEISKMIDDKLSNVNINVNNTTNYNNWKVVVGDDAYYKLIEKLGKEEALSLLTGGKPIDMARRLYFENLSPDQYPIACNDKDKMHFRFINSDKEIVDDKGGSKINSTILSGIHNAMIRAVNETMKDPTTENLRNLQSRLLYSLNEDVKPDLSQMSYNPDHPFFTSLSN